MITTWLLVATLAMVQSPDARQSELDFQETGAGLLRDCDTLPPRSGDLDQATADRMSFRCLHYLAGLRDGLVFGSVFGTSVVCEPGKVTWGQRVMVVQKFLRDHPEKLHEPKGLLAMEALMEAFPCRK